MPQAQAQPKNFSQPEQAKAEGGKTKAEKKAEKPAKAEKKHEPAPEAADEGDENDEVYANEPKEKDPFAEMPKPSFNMDEFKRVYSNEDTLTKALPYFWENFDKQNMSIWFCEYKYPEQLKQVFMSCNLVAGFFQRLEKLRKNAFGSMCVFGEDHNNVIAGIWFWRGQELAFQLSPDWQVDYESYAWKRLTVDDEETKKLVKQYFVWEGEHNGKKFNQGKIYK